MYMYVESLCVCFTIALQIKVLHWRFHLQRCTWRLHSESASREAPLICIFGPCLHWSCIRAALVLPLYANRWQTESVLPFYMEKRCAADSGKSYWNIVLHWCFSWLWASTWQFCPIFSGGVGRCVRWHRSGHRGWVQREIWTGQSDVCTYRCLKPGKQEK